MKQELQDELFKKYPKLFGQRKLTIYESCMPFGIECGTGWYNIIDSACSCIQHHVNSERQQRSYALRYNRALKRAISGNKAYLEYFYRKLYTTEESLNKRVEEEIKRAEYRKVPEKYPYIQFTQIKEKFGGLRLYTNYHGDYIDGVISMAMDMSEKTCETCGQPGKMRGKGWYYVACNQHAKETDLLMDLAEG